MHSNSVVSTAVSLRRGDFSCRELITDALARRQNDFGAYRSVDDDAVLAQADVVDRALAAGFDLGPWMGMPVSIKDLYGVPGFPVFAGSPTQLPAEWEHAGPLVQALKRQLAIVVGKTHTSEFAFGGLGTNAHTPTPRNPFDVERHRVPGGSSSGAGVSLTEGSAVLALGTDTAGSVRVPASYTGNIGLKTTHGRWSVEGIVPLSPTLDSAGILTRSVEDLRLAFATFDPAWESASHFVAQGPRIIVSDLRIARCDDFFWDDCSPGVAEAVDEAIARLAHAGARIHPAEFTEFHPAYALFQQGGPVPPELYRFLHSRLPDWLDTLDPNVAARMSEGATMPAYEYLGRLHSMRSWARAVEAKLRHFDMIIAPTVPLTPPVLTDLQAPDAYRRHNMLALRNTSVVSYLKLCALTVPVGLDREGMPVGMMLVARPGHDDRLVAFAMAIERLVIQTLRPSSVGV